MTYFVSQTPRLRVARPTDNMADVLRFYTVGLGLQELGRFQDHDGYDGYEMTQFLVVSLLFDFTIIIL